MRTVWIVTKGFWENQEIIAAFATEAAAEAFAAERGPQFFADGPFPFDSTEPPTPGGVPIK